MLRAAHAGLLRVFRRLPTAWRLRVVHVLAPTFTVGAVCVIDRGDRHLLLVQHSYRNRWGLPGGLLKRGEDAVDGVRREVMEEVGLDIELVGQPTVVVAPDPRRVDIVYRARPAAGADAADLRPRSPEILAVRWVPHDDLPELQPEAASAMVALARAMGETT